MEELKERFDYAKLALFQVRLLSELQETTDSSVSEVVSRVWLANNLPGKPNLINQNAFFGMGYICLVWLWESARSANRDSEIVHLVSERWDIPEGILIGGTRENVKTDHKVLLRALRNAISHGRVFCHDDYFVFKDQNQHSKEEDSCEIKLSFAELGQLCECVIRGFNTLLYPEGDAS